MKVNIGIPETQRQFVALELNKLLADESLLSTQTRNYRWNIEGANFNERHLLYEEQFSKLDEILDGIAERINQDYQTISNLLN